MSDALRRQLRASLVACDAPTALAHSDPRWQAAIGALFARRCGRACFWPANDD